MFPCLIIKHYFIPTNLFKQQNIFKVQDVEKNSPMILYPINMLFSTIYSKHNIVSLNLKHESKDLWVMGP